ncbi:hypothetical protein DKM44_09335 [Deinococcus irradiatisoli]|uniref:GGDEF domain-containing protein n=1 Tax=Deinococcus irradiatisoli TaxID=2202254 RepID=A0A2Z3JE12_9DEIO|nr:GGDEF domain-containing protein [Deinococcus irradiatisoli]AWN23407.1 hypothetical protein DKM44_09335 [Deinococcus irradiatisoli]
MLRAQSPASFVRIDRLKALRRHGFSVLVLVTLVAALLALLLQRGHIDPLDRAALPTIAVSMLVMEVCLRLHWLTLSQAANTTYFFCSAYLLALFHHQFSSFAPQYHMLSEGVLWFPALYMMAFVQWRARQAAQVVAGLLLTTLVIAAFHLIPLWQSGHLSERLLASTTQFFLSGTLISLIQYLVASARQHYDELRRLAFLDSLTGLPNRRAAQSILETLDASQQPYAVVIFDLDFFKQVNDRHGHAEGDRVLTQAAQLTGQHLAAPRLLARWGGEEFLMILPSTSAEEARQTAERARSNLAAYSFTTGQVTASFGAAMLGANDNHVQLLGRADHALRQAKASGRNRVLLAGDGPDWPAEPPSGRCAPALQSETQAN